MKFLKWLLAIFIVGAIGDIGHKLLSQRQSVIDDNWEKVVAELSPKLPMTNGLGLQLTHVSYLSPTFKQYFSMPKGSNPENQYKQQLTDTVCTDQSKWMFEKGFRIENIFQPEVPDAFSTDTTIVIDEKQCQHRGEVHPYTPPPAPAVSTASVQQASPAYVVAPAPAASDTAAAVN